MIKLIAAIDSTGLLGFNNTIPWSYSEDMRRFKKVTMNSILIMGKNTVLSLPRKLTGRYVIAISDSGEVDQADITFYNISDAIEHALKLQNQDGRNIFVAGGGSIYRQVLLYDFIDELDITYVPDVEVPEDAKNIVCFPIYNLEKYNTKSATTNEKDPRLTHVLYVKNHV